MQIHGLSGNPSILDELQVSERPCLKQTTCNDSRGCLVTSVYMYTNIHVHMNTHAHIHARAHACNHTQTLSESFSSHQNMLI